MEGSGGMTVNVYIERLVLDGLEVTPADVSVVQRSVERELTNLLRTHGLGVRSGGAVPAMRSEAIRHSPANGAATLGGRIAGAVHQCIGKPK